MMNLSKVELVAMAVSTGTITEAKAKRLNKTELVAVIDLATSSFPLMPATFEVAGETISEPTTAAEIEEVIESMEGPLPEIEVVEIARWNAADLVAKPVAERRNRYEERGNLVARRSAIYAVYKQNRELLAGLDLRRSADLDQAEALLRNQAGENAMPKDEAFEQATVH